MNTLKRFVLGAFGSAVAASLSAAFAKLIWGTISGTSVIANFESLAIFACLGVFSAMVFAIGERDWLKRDYMLYGAVLMDGVWLFTIAYTNDYDPATLLTVLLQLAAMACIGAFIGIGYFAVNGYKRF